MNTNPPDPSSIQPIVPSSQSFETSDSTINRKVAFASVASSLGTIISIFLATFLINLPFLANISQEDKGTLKTSLMASITGIITLIVGYQTNPGASDGIKPKTPIK